jgi:hypothetical protein
MAGRSGRRSAANAEIAKIIQSVVIEEMLHVSLVCNVLNAVGGSPNIDDPAFVSNYPGPLPGGVEAQLKVGLCPVSLILARDVFMKIEQPEDPTKHGAVAESELQNPITVGQFYRTIQDERTPCNN